MLRRCVEIDFDEVIKKRKSIRKFSNRTVCSEYISEIIKCGYLAPRACHTQFEKFILVYDLETKKKIVKYTYSGAQYKPNSEQTWLEDASIIIIVCVDMRLSMEKYGEYEYKKTSYLNVSACIENMLLKAVDLGLGACYITGFLEKDIHNFLKLEDYIEVIALIPLGYENKN